MYRSIDFDCESYFWKKEVNYPFSRDRMFAFELAAQHATVQPVKDAFKFRFSGGGAPSAALGKF